MFKTIRNAWRIEDIRKKMIFTLFIIAIFRIGSVIPVPFMNATIIRELIRQHTELGGALGYYNMMSGGALSTGALFALGISPYITSSIVIQLLAVAIPYLENLGKEGPEGQKKLQVITRYTTLGLALLQSIAYYLLNRNAGAVTKFEGSFANTFAGIVIVLSFTAGAMFVVWLGERIDERGIGNGISILLFVGIISRAPSGFTSLYTAFLKGGKYYALIPITIIMFLIIIFAIIVMTSAERRIPVQYAKRVVGRKLVGGQASYMPIKVMMSGVMPVIFAGAILSVPAMIKQFVDPMAERTIGKVLGIFDYNRLPYAIFYLVLIIAFNYFYVAIQYNPMEMANDLRKNSGTIPGIRPGQPTADFISKVISRITLVGALFIAVLAIMPIIAGAIGGLPIALGGTSIIIVVNVALDTVKELESMMMMRHYKGFLE